ncbi:uncharacterized protein LOC144028518 [Festucalex cinctus]
MMNVAASFTRNMHICRHRVCARVETWCVAVSVAILLVIFLISFLSFNSDIDKEHFRKDKNHTRKLEIPQLIAGSANRLSSTEATTAQYRIVTTTTKAPTILRTTTTTTTKKKTWQKIMMVAYPNGHFGKLVEALRVGSRIAFAVKLDDDPTRFWVNLLQSDRSNIVMHMDSRTHFLNDRSMIVVNSYLNGKWDEEQHHSNFPFQPGKTYEIIIQVEDGYFTVDVDDIYLLKYYSTVSRDTITDVSVKGNVTLLGVMQI